MKTKSNELRMMGAACATGVLFLSAAAWGTVKETSPVERVKEKAADVIDATKDAAATTVDKTKEVAHDAVHAVKKTAKKVDARVRVSWTKTKAYSSEEEPVYRGGVKDSLGDCRLDIADLRDVTPAEAPAYFRTRLQSLDEQAAHLDSLYASLTPAQIANRNSAARRVFDQGIADLQSAIDQARLGLIATQEPVED